jgi:hypothetical protein
VKGIVECFHELGQAQLFERAVEHISTSGTAMARHKSSLAQFLQDVRDEGPTQAEMLGRFAGTLSLGMLVQE